MNLNLTFQVVFALIFSVTFGFYINGKNRVANSCVTCHDTDPNRINVHLVHHSHDDVGWIKTLDQYYWGLNNSIAHVGVQYILTSVVNALWDYPDRKFIQVETAFYWKWWQDQDDIMRTKFRTLIEKGQIEMVNGAWSMNDEACVNYQSTIDQFTWGFRIINDTLGQCGNPTIGWQIDPFGHSREHASLLNKIGFDGLFFARLDQNDRALRKRGQNMDFLWKTSTNKDDSVIFGGTFAPDHTYYVPGGFCFDLLCSDDSINDNPNDGGYNLEAKVNEFANNVKGYASFYKTNHILITMGGDFYFQAAEINFKNSDKLIRGFENHPDIKLLYSTPSCYLKSVNEAQPTLELKTDDFFPYGSSDHTYWTGYFSSRQNLKRFERTSHNILQTAKQLNALAQATGQSEIDANSLNKLREAIGVLQHHDAITGTEKQHVTNDYIKMLSVGIADAEASFSKIIGNLLQVNVPELSSCLLANMSICTQSQSSDNFVVSLYNPLSWPVNYTIRLPVDGDSFSVTGPNGDVKFDAVDPISDFSFVKLDGAKPATNELVFIASGIPAMGIQSYSVVKRSNNTANDNKKYLLTNNAFKFGNEDIGFELDSTTNLLKSVTMNGETLEITQQFLYYLSRNGSDGFGSSGAYIFRSDGEAIAFGNPTIITSVQGDVVDEVHQKFNDWITQIIRVYKGSQNYIEFDWLVGPVDVTDDTGKEIISRFTVSNFQNNNTFYTDSNGREMIQRVLNYRPTYQYDPTLEPISSNYYPITSKISIRDEKKKLQVSVLNDRSQGGSSLEEGQLELMVHRRTLKDDSKGVGEALNETEFDQGVVARGQHYLIIGSSVDVINNDKTVVAQERIVAQEKLLQPWVGVGDASQLSKDDLSELISTTYSALLQKLPENINILTLEPWTDSSYILRLEHILEQNEDPDLSSVVTVNITSLFYDFEVANVIETTLGANNQLESVDRYDWGYGPKAMGKPKSLDVNKVELAPMDIRTFIVELLKQ